MCVALKIKIGLLVFYSAISIGASLAIFTTASTVSSIFLLIVVFLSSVGGLFILGSEFLAFTILIVYVGAVSILFVFVVMLLGPGIEKQQNYIKKPAEFSLFNIIPIFIVLIFFKKILGFFLFYCSDLKKNSTITSNLPYPKKANVDMDFYSNDISIVSKNLYIDHAPLFYLVALILLVSMIGAIILCKGRFGGKKK